MEKTEKCIKKSNLKQLQVLVENMEANPEFARGSAVFGKNKLSMEEQWINLAKKLNSHGPPLQSIVEWKKDWTDLKSRTKKKIAENHKSLRETGGGLYKVNPLSELEQIVDRTLFLSKAAVPSGKVFGLGDNTTSKNEDSIKNCFISLVETPPRRSKVAVVTPSRQGERGVQIQHPSSQLTQQTTQQPSQQPTQQSPYLSPLFQQQKRHNQGDEYDLPTCSSAKKKKTDAEEQIGLIRCQIKLGEQSAALAKQHSDAAIKMAEATTAIADAAKRLAGAAEIQATAAKETVGLHAKLLLSLEVIAKALSEKK